MRPRLPPKASICSGSHRVVGCGGEYRQAAGATPQRLKRRVRRLSRRQVDRILELISAGIAGPHIADTTLRHVLGPLRGNDIRTALRTLID